MNKYIIYLIVIMVTILFLYVIDMKNTDEYLDYEYADIDMDNEMEKLAITHKKGSKFGDKFIILEKDKQNNWLQVYENDFSKIKPWKLEVADIDGDNNLEIAIGVYKSTVYDKNERKRLFIFNYNFKDRLLLKKWTGSKLENELIDFYFDDVISLKGYELITEEKKETKTITNTYYWFGFGFEKLN